MIGQPDCVTLPKYEPFGKKINVPIFVKYMFLTQEQMNTLPIKISDRTFCGNPNNKDDLSHYTRMNHLINHIPNFYFYFLHFEFKIFERKDHRNNNDRMNTRTMMVRELCLYPRKGQATAGAYAIFSAIEFIPSIKSCFSSNMPYVQFVLNFQDRITIWDNSTGDNKLHVIPRALYFYHVT